MNTVSKLVISKDVRIDFDEEILYGQDQMYNSYPVVFPTALFFLEATEALWKRPQKS